MDDQRNGSGADNYFSATFLSADDLSSEINDYKNVSACSKNMKTVLFLLSCIGTSYVRMCVTISLKNLLTLRPFIIAL